MISCNSSGTYVQSGKAVFCTAFTNGQPEKIDRNICETAGTSGLKVGQIQLPLSSMVIVMTLSSLWKVVSAGEEGTEVPEGASVGGEPGEVRVMSVVVGTRGTYVATVLE